VQTIKEFQGPYRFLSNFWPAEVVLDGMIFPSVENAFASAKTLSLSERAAFQSCTASQAKQLGKRVKLRADWMQVRVQIMEELVTQKFSIEPLRSQLLATGDAPLEEGNWWNDTFWGICRGVGENQLGKILIRVRDSLRVSAHLEEVLDT